MSSAIKPIKTLISIYPPPFFAKYLIKSFRIKLASQGTAIGIKKANR